MLKGQGPFVQKTGPNGKVTFIQIELHHLSGVETFRGGNVFGTEYSDGGMVELESDTHDIYDGILHIPKKKGESFRVDTLTGGKSEDSYKYDKFRGAYWRKRARGFLSGKKD